MNWRRAIAVGLAAVGPSGCLLTPAPVTRVTDGRLTQGRYLAPEAYSSYVRGAYLEARGHLQAALSAYQAGLQEDPESVQLWTRVGALRCRLRSTATDQAFAQAHQLDSSYEPLWRELAACQLDRGEPERAQHSAERALQLDPNSDEASILTATIYRRLGRQQDARRLLEALVARRPSSRQAWLALRDDARHRHDEATHAFAVSQLAALPALTPSDLRRTRPTRSNCQQVDQALREAQLARARQLAAAATLSAGQLAVRAAALGQSKLAAEQATLVLGADPSDGDAWVAALVAADLEGDTAAFEQALAALSSRPVRPGPLGARLMAELLRRRVGDEAATAWLTAYGPLPSPVDPLESVVAKRR